MGLFDWWYGTTPPPPPPRRAQPAPTPQARLQTAQTHAQQSLNNCPPGATLPCGAPATPTPCDLSVFEVVENRQKFNYEASLPDFLGKLRDQLIVSVGGRPPPPPQASEPPKERAYPAKFEYTAPGNPNATPFRSGAVIEMIALGPKETKKTKVDLTVRTDYQFCGAKNHHPQISIKLPDGTWERYPQTAQHTMNVYRAERAYDRLPGNMSGVLSYFWVLANTPAVYEIYGLVCGARRPGQPKRTQAGYIRVFPADQYEFTVKLPPIFKIGYERYAGRGGQRGVVTNELSAQANLPGLQGNAKYSSERAANGETSRGVSLGGTRYSPSGSTGGSYAINSTNGNLSETVTRTAREGGLSGSRSVQTEWATGNQTRKLAIEPAAAETAVKVSLKHNGQELDVAAWITNTVNMVRRFSETVEEIYKAIQDWKPKIGWFFNVEVCFLTGSFGAKWGYKEWADHRVFRAYEVYAQLELMKAEVKLAFGVDATVKGVGVVCKVEGAIEGTVSVKASFARVSPTETESKRAGFTGEIKGTLSFNATVISSGWFELKGSIETGISVEGALKIDRNRAGIAVEKVMWTGIKASGTLHVRFWFDQDCEIQLMNPKQIGGPFNYP